MLRGFLTFSFMALALLLSGCSESDHDRIALTIIDDANPESAKSAAKTLNSSELLEIRAAEAQGLVSIDAEGQILPALAERWIIPETERPSMIFRLGEHYWSDGKPVLAKEVATILAGRIRALRGTPFGDELASIDEVIARNDEVIEIRLSAYQPRLIETLASPQLAIYRQGAGAPIGSGPMYGALLGDAWRLRHMRFETIDEEDRLERLMLRPELLVSANSAAEALVRYRRGFTQLVLGGRFQHVPYLWAVDINDNDVVKDPVFGHFGLKVENDQGLLSDPQMREALAMAINRSRLVSSFRIEGWRQMESLTPVEFTSRGDVAEPAWTSLDMDERMAEAQRRVQRAAGGERPRLTISLPDGAGSKLLFAQIRTDFATIGIDLNRVEGDKTADLTLIDETADHDGLDWFLRRLSCDAMPICSEEGDELVRVAGLSELPQQRSILLAGAEQQIYATYGYIPIASPLRFSVAPPQFPGMAPSVRGWHPLQKLGSPPD